MKNENHIENICREEGKIQLIKDWLGISFFIAAAIVAVIYYKAVTAPITDHGETAVITIIMTLSVFAGLLMFGYFYNRMLSKRLDSLWEQKKLLF